MLTKEFVLAGRAIFTVANPTGTHYTFRVSHKEASAQWPETWFVSLLTGSDNENDYTYLGLLRPDITVKLTAKSKYKPDTLPVKVLNWALGLIRTGGELPPGYSIHHEGRCCRCGRTLTVPSSIESGIGPECAKLMGL
jgi:hypothetical protein